MKKPLKLVLIIVGSIAALMVVVVALAFTSGVQTWAVRRALAGQPGLQIEVAHVAAGLSKAELRGVRVVQDGTVIVAPQVEAAYSATDYLFGGKINVASVTAKGVEVDTRNAVAKPTPPAETALAPFSGILSAIRLPGEVHVGRIDIDAKVLLPNAQTATVVVQGGGIAPGQLATFTWKGTFVDETAGAPLAGAETAGKVQLRTTTDLRIDTVQIDGDVRARGPNLPNDLVMLGLELKQPAANAAETIALRVSLSRAMKVEPLLVSNVTYAPGKPVLSGTWNLTVRSEQFAAVLASFGLPEVALAGDGSFSYDVASSAATAAGTLDGTISNLEKLGAEFAGIGNLKIRAVFDGGASQETAQLGKLEFDVATEDGRKFVTVAAQQKLTINLKDMKFTPERPGTELARVSLIGLPLAWAQPFVKPRTIAGDVSGVFVVDAEPDGSRIKAHAVEPLVIREVTLREGDQLLVDRVTLSVSPRVDYTAARIVAELEKISVTTPVGDTITGSVSADTLMGATPATSFAAQLNGRLSALIKPYLPVDTGPLTLAVAARGRHEGNALSLAELKVQVDREGGALLAGLEAAQPLAIDLAALKVSAADATGTAARVRWGEIPLAWAQPYVAGSTLAGTLTAGQIEVALLGADAIGVKVADKISARGTNFAMEGREYLRGADFSTDLNATWKAGTLTAEIRQLELKQGAENVLTAAFSGEVTPATATAPLRANGRGTVATDFAVLAKQPALAAQLPLLRGAVNAKFDGAMDNGVKGKFELTARDLVAREGATPLGTLELSADAVLDAANNGTVRIPLVVSKSGRRSDLLLEGKVGMKPGEVSFTGRIAGDQLVVDDLQAFNALAAAPASTPATPAPRPTPQPNPPRPAGQPPVAGTPPARDTTPVWAGFAGRIDLDIKSIKQGEGNTLQGLRGALVLAPDRLAIENVGGQLNGNPFRVSTLLNFDAKLARPYTLAGALDVPGFDVGEFLRKADPSTKEPALETKVTIATKFNGTAANLAEFQDRLAGQFDFTGTQGVLRALNKKAETSSTALGLLGLAAGLAGEGRLAEGLVGASELAAMLKDIQFDGITIRAERTAEGRIAVNALEIASPVMRLTGTGHIEQKAGTELGKAPLVLSLQLAAKDTLAEGLNRAKQLDGRQDDKGYYMMTTPFTLSGTVSKPDSTEFWAKLLVNTGAGFLR